MNFISDATEERLKNSTMLEYLKYMEGRIRGISHRPKSDSAYLEAQEYVRHIKYRFVSEYKLSWEDFDLKVGHNLKLSADILDMYSHGDSDKKKQARIEEFKKEYLYDLGNMIRSRERQKDNPGSPIQEDEV